MRFFFSIHQIIAFSNLLLFSHWGCVILRITGYMGLDIMGCRPCGFVLADKEWWLYRREARDGEGNRQYFRNTNQGLEGDLPPGYRDLLLRFPPVIAHVTGLISPAATGCDSGIRDSYPRCGYWRWCAAAVDGDA